MSEKHSVSVDLYLKIDGQLNEIRSKMRLGLKNKGDRAPYNPVTVSNALQDIVEGKFNPNRVENKFLRLISTGETINAVDGKATIVQAKDTFKSHIDPNFKNFKTNKKGNATDETPINVYEMIQDAKFAQIFGSLSNDLDSLCLTQHQVINFCEKHSTLLKQDGYATLFLFKVYEHYFIARVGVRFGSLYVDVYRFGHNFVWRAASRRRVVTPKDLTKEQKKLKGLYNSYVVTGNVSPRKKSQILKLISNNEKLLINATDGSGIIEEAKDTFKAGIDPYFKRLRTNQSSDSTVETPAQVYEMKKDATLTQIFVSLSNDLDTVCLTQSQIINFCRKYHKWLRRDGYGTFFLFKVNKRYFVAYVYVDPDLITTNTFGLRVRVVGLDDGHVWGASTHRRVVAPQQTVSL